MKSGLFRLATAKGRQRTPFRHQFSTSKDGTNFQAFVPKPEGGSLAQHIAHQKEIHAQLYLKVKPTFATLDQERKHRIFNLLCAFRLFAKFGFDEGAAGHFTVKDPEFKEQFWVNPFGRHFSLVTADDLLLVDTKGNIVQGKGLLNQAAFAIHSAVHVARPDAIAAAHTHSAYGRAWSTLGRLLDPITQDACAFYEDHGIYGKYGGVAFEEDEGTGIARAIGDKKACILQNHGLLTVGNYSVAEAAWWYISMERCCQVQLAAESAVKNSLPDKSDASRTSTGLTRIPHNVALLTQAQVGTPFAGWFSFQPLYELIIQETPYLKKLQEFWFPTKV